MTTTTKLRKKLRNGLWLVLVLYSATKVWNAQLIFSIDNIIHTVALLSSHFTLFHSFLRFNVRLDFRSVRPLWQQRRETTTQEKNWVLLLLNTVSNLWIFIPHGIPVLFCRADGRPVSWGRRFCETLLLSHMQISLWRMLDNDGTLLDLISLLPSQDAAAMHNTGCPCKESNLHGSTMSFKYHIYIGQ